MKIKIKLRTLLTLCCVILSIFLFPLVSVWKKSQVQDMAKENALLQERIQSARNENRVYGFLRDRLIARPRVESIARKDIGLDYPAGRDVRLVVRQKPLVPGEMSLEKNNRF
jgi:hypothetical protein